MPQAEITDTTTASEEDPHIGDVEPLLAGLRAEIEILHHLVQSSDEVDADTWLHVETRLEESRKKIHQTWHAAFQRHNADRREAEAALKAVRAEKAAPGSRKDAETVDALRRMLRSVAVVIMKDTSDFIAHDVTGAAEPEPRQDAELIRLCDRLVEIHEAEVKIGDEFGDDDAACDAAQKPYRDEWKTIEARLSDLGRPRTLAGAVAMARAAPVNVNVNDDGSPMSGELGMHMLLAVCAYLTNDERPYFQPAAEDPS